jgi:foldase protein PrsA
MTPPLMMFLLSRDRYWPAWRLMGSMVLAACCAGAAVAEEPAAKPLDVASVNGRTLSEREFVRRCETFVGGRTDTAVGYLVLQEWIQQTLAEDEAHKKNLLPTPAQLNERVRELQKKFEAGGEKFEDWLAFRGRTAETFREDVRQQLIAENLLTEGIDISDVEVQLYYANNKQVIGTPAQLRVSRITVNDRKVAQEVDAALKQGGSFEELAGKRSLDEYRERGGHVPGAIEADPKAKGPVEPELMEKLIKLERGKVLGPVKLDDYWVFVRLDEKLAASVPPLSDVQELLRANLKVQKGGPDRLKAAEARLDGLAREAKVEIFRPEYRYLLKLLQKSE